jgi:hypothetical protein
MDPSAAEPKSPSAQGADSADSLLHRGLLREVGRAADSYGLVLILLAIDYVFLSVGWTGSWVILLNTAAIVVTVLIAFRTSRCRGRVFGVVRIAGAVAVVAAIVAAIDERDVATGVVFIIVGLLVLACPVAIAARIVKHTRVTVETILGAICIYILLGIVFTYFDLAIQLVSGASFFAQTGTHGPSDFVYYSYITMTTVGYGDLSPAVGLPRTMAVLEALTGQIFLVVMVARLVSLYTPTPIKQGLVARIEDRTGPSEESGDTSEKRDSRSTHGGGRRTGL